MKAYESVFMADVASLKDLVASFDSEEKGSFLSFVHDMEKQMIKLEEMPIKTHEQLEAKLSALQEFNIQFQTCVEKFGLTYENVAKSYEIKGENGNTLKGEDIYTIVKPTVINDLKQQVLLNPNAEVERLLETVEDSPVMSRLCNLGSCYFLQREVVRIEKMKEQSVAESVGQETRVSSVSRIDPRRDEAKTQIDIDQEYKIKKQSCVDSIWYLTNIMKEEYFKVMEYDKMDKEEAKRLKVGVTVEDILKHCNSQNVTSASSRKLDIAINSYEAIQELYKSLEPRNETPNKKDCLEAYNNKFKEEKTQQTLKENPDGNISRFFRMSAYYLLRSVNLNKAASSLLTDEQKSRRALGDIKDIDDVPKIKLCK